MRSFQVFATMAPEEAVSLLRGLQDKAPGVLLQAVLAASAAIKARPVYLKRQPFEKRAEAVRRALARVAANDLASEILAVYFLQCRKELLIEWLDLLGLKHEEGTLEEDEPTEPEAQALEAAVTKFRGDGEDRDRAILLRAFAAQEAVSWPALEALLDAE